MEFVAIFLFYAACVFLLITVHESGHYLAGLAGGIPASDIRIRLFAFPQHVVLRSGERWVSPSDYDPFVETVWRHLVTTPRVYLFVAGGLLLETVFTTIVSVLLVQFGWPKMALAVVGLSLVLIVPWLILEPLMAWRTGHAWGDFSGMWFIAKLPTVILVLGLLAVRALLGWYAAAA
jgi:hypothetical protein